MTRLIEETEVKKDKQWLEKAIEGIIRNYESFPDKTNWNNGYIMALHDYKSLINQLDEPEDLSQELPAIPQWVADNIEDKKRVGVLLSVAIAGFPEFKLQKELNIDEHECNEIYARAWLDGYTVEELEE